MDVPGFKEKIHEQEIEVISEKKGEMTFILKQSADTALDDPAITEIVALLRADKRAKHLDLLGLEEPIKIPKKKKKQRSKRNKSKSKSSVYRYGTDRLGHKWIPIEQQKAIQKMKWERNGRKGRWQDIRIW